MAGFRSSPARAALLGAGALLLAAAPARADRCDDLAKELRSQIDGITIGRTAANVIYLSHPAAKQLRLGCRSRRVSNEIYGATDARKPSPAFRQLIASAAAIVFTIPKPDTLRGVNRCLGRLGLLRGNDITTRFRRLDMNCTRSKTGATVTISRGRDE
ncbi:MULTISPECIES: hypothetical protein [Rhodopseudomonas]|uniref:Uncharacterized protein n=1 Tax=Rhodopseudomonas palustris TaxID=1076 RepID=A0A0D7EII8_RHOPL|nr:MULTISPECIES: hypothetical protein [Rhodopseudomonas]KIZ40325.1 hypothetical protein OO17_17980 [Rhodopseudomonas palustris]MDF3810505.1 hypothetical protein [Rhodopseudomonas sp. BAL398]WOK20238.1 hypothetical protein RBJ75_12270 [Rhodopseudomonas sp. BAL398]